MSNETEALVRQKIELETKMRTNLVIERVQKTHVITDRAALEAAIRNDVPLNSSDLSPAEIERVAGIVVAKVPQAVQDWQHSPEGKRARQEELKRMGII